VTVIWFVILLIANNIGDHEPLMFDPRREQTRPAPPRHAVAATIGGRTAT